MYTGFRSCEVASDLIDKLHTDGQVESWDKRYNLYPNMYLELIDMTDPKHTALGRVDTRGEKVNRVLSKSISGIKPRNREQVFALDALMDDNVPIVVLSGSAGTGKTILALAMAMEKIQKGLYRKVILTRPMSEVGKYKLGALPGDAVDKFSPYLLNYLTNLEQFVQDRFIVRDLLEQDYFEVIPLQLFRGASFNKCLVLADEMQVWGHMETLTIGTRIGEGSKLVIMGDLNQRDEKIAKDKTGMYKLINDRRIKESALAATVELQQCVRSATARLFAEVFEE